MGGNKIRLTVINGSMNAQTYINDVLAVEALPFIQFHGLLLCTIMPVHNQPQQPGSFLRQIMSMSWTGLRIVSIEMVWDELGCLVRRGHAIHTVNDLEATLQAKWTNLPVPFIQRYVNSMSRRITACIAQNGEHMRY